MDKKIITENADVSAVILDWNCAEIMEQNLPRLLKDASVYRQIIIIDQNSSDNSEAVCKRYPEITYVKNPVNLGSGRGRNIGNRLALSDEKTGFVFSMDADIITPYNIGTSLRYGLDQFKEIHDLGMSHPDCQTEKIELVDDYIPLVNAFFPATMLSYTWCSMQRRELFEKIETLFRSPGVYWSEEGPYGMPGWGVDDNDYAYRIIRTGCNIGGIANLKWENGDLRPPLVFHVDHRCYNDLFKETGIWPNQHNTTYERRIVLMYFDWAANWNYTVNTLYVLMHQGSIDRLKEEIRKIHGNPEYAGQGYERRPYRIIVPTFGFKEASDWLWDKGCRWTPGDTEADWGVRPLNGGMDELAFYKSIYHPQAEIQQIVV